MTGKTFRSLTRRLHIIVALVIGTYLYSPWSQNPIFSNVVLWLAIPVLVVTGLFMWKQGWVMKKLNLS